MRSILAACLVLILLLAVSCSGGAAAPTPTAAGQAAGTAKPPASPVAAAATATKAAPATAVSGGPSAPQAGALKEALTAKEAFAVADQKAKSINSAYRLLEIIGCTLNSTSYTKDEHLVEGKCATWLLRYTRPVKPGSYEGYYDLMLWVGPNGILKQEETPKEKAAAVLAKGEVADWRVDSTQAVEIAEKAGGKEYRQQNPTWDPGRFDSDRNAVLRANLEFVPYFDVTYTQGKEIAGAKSVVWTIKYPPVDRFVYVIDAYTGEVLLKGEAKK